ncbi:WD40 repeat-like protein [Guyanagaster necrorhizus]|uniref:WD40 repeat-like protein n=1 Tax=Guyanagaster necrorhizus TaxID=856835 RepID=A0A9P7W133_9AGAR|nr:WD40 repeat-like protein [Guyanagaster necrorhizus MCA 3950]KAG7449441.1 WD40 repeat-like protein [Guyanagaster necrorhizus MCA 3950]
MIPSPSSSPRPVFQNRTNFNESSRPRAKYQQRLSFALPTPPKCSELKRSVQGPNSLQSRKRARPLEDENVCEEDGMPHVPFRRERIRGTTHSRGYLAIHAGSRPHDVSTRHILESFVSHNKRDVYKCQSAGIDYHLTLPYSCSYSHAAQRGESTLLAVSTEQGTIHIINTTKGDPWDPEPLHTTIQAHDNGVFDVKWDESDKRLATASADQSARILCLSTNTVLHRLRGHTSAVKSISWDPSNPNLLSTGGKDGTICLWDLRVGEGRIDGESLPPILSIHGAHEEPAPLGKSKTRRKSTPSTKTVTNLIYSDTSPHNLVSSGSYNGILRCWDVRSLTSSKKILKYKLHKPLFVSTEDPTIFHGSRRPRGIISLAEGSGPTAGLLFGLGADSRVHTYTRSSLLPMSNSYAHERMQTNSFYITLAMSPCGRWLSSGSTGRGSAFLYDVHSAWQPFAMEEKGVELQGQQGDIGGVAWCSDGLVTGADDGTVRVWRPDVDAYHHCLEHPDEKRWHWSWSVQS